MVLALKNDSTTKLLQLYLNITMLLHCLYHRSESWKCTMVLALKYCHAVLNNAMVLHHLYHVDHGNTMVLNYMRSTMVMNKTDQMVQSLFIACYHSTKTV